MENLFMKRAAELAVQAKKNGDVPVGAVIVCNGTVIAEGFNKREEEKNALLHAEIVAIDKACKVLNRWRLDDCDIYITLEPCIMCAGAIINARIKNVFFGTYDKYNGAFGTLIDCLKSSSIHTPNIYGGIMEEQCDSILASFFNKIR